jgi:hypothetical protein
MDGVTCSSFEGDDSAIQAARITTRDAFDPDMNLEEVTFVPSSCAVRRALRDGSMTIQATTAATWDINTNINNLGYSDTQTAYDTLIQNLDSSISSGAYTTALKDNGEAQGTDVLASASVTADPVVSEFTEDTVSPSSDSGDTVSTGLIVGVVIGCSIVLIAVAVGSYFMFGKRRRTNKNAEEEWNSRNSNNSSSSSSFVGKPSVATLSVQPRSEPRGNKKKSGDSSLGGDVELDDTVSNPIGRKKGANNDASTYGGL